jgi:hypothetical protein
MPERLQGGVLRSTFEAVQGWSTDPQATGHFNLRESGTLPEPAKEFRERLWEIHEQNACSSACPHVNI